MPWFSPWSDFSDLIKKKVCRYLLQRYLGNFMEEKLTLEQLNIDITNGTGTVHDVNLYCESLNELCEAQEWGIEVTGGRIGAVTVSVPWNALMTEDSHIEIRDLFISIRPLARVKEGTSMLESMWSSMSSSMQLAQECLEKEGGVTISAQTSHVMDGLERFAQTIDNVLNRVKARLRNTEIRLEYVPPETDRGVALIIKIENLEYQNEAGDDSNDKEKSPDYDNEEQTNKNSILLSTYATHHIVMEGISFYTEEFRIVGSEKSSPEKKFFNEQFYSTINELPETEQSYVRQNQSSESDRAESDLEDENSIEIYRTEQILLGRLSSRQEIRIKMKQIENVAGPKVELDMQLGAITLFLSPRQMHSLLLLSDALLYDPVPEQKIIQKPKHNLESQQGENELRKDSGFNANAMTGGIGFNQGWSGEQNSDNFESLPFTNAPTIKELSDSFVSSSSSMTSSMGSSASQSTQNSQRIQRRRPIDFETNADISKFNLRIACCALVILHEDVLVECASPLAEAPLSEQSVRQLKLLSDHFFETTGAMGVGLGANEMAHAGKLLDAACRKNNLRLLLAPIILEGEEQRNSNGSSLRLGISIARVDLREVLGNFSVPLIEFCRKDNNGSLPKRPEVTINYKQIQQTIRGSSGKRFAPPKSEIKILVGSFLTEMDISIVDRLSAILNPSPFNKPHKPPTNSQKRETKIEINFEGTSIDLKLRFPIADLRPIHDPQRVPWWERNVRPDYLLLSFQQILINFSPPCKFEIQANEINIFYCESEKSQPIPIGKSVMVEKTGTRFTQSIIEYPKIIIELPSDRILLESCQSGRSSDDSDSGPTSGESIGVNTPKEEDATPFSSKRVCRESDTPHKKQSTDNPETLIIPGDKAEMDSFCENSMKTAKIQIRICLPVVSLQLRSKHLYEIIYNRINSDLLLWEPCAPAVVVPTPIINKMSNSLLNAGMMDSLYVPYTMCKSGINYDSSSSAATSESESENDIYYSITDKQQSKKPILQVSPPIDNSSALAFQLNIGQGILTTYAPVRDSQNHVIPGQLGEFVIKIKSTYLFSVSGYRGNSTLNYFCLQSNAAELYHYGLIPVPTSDPPLRVFGCMLPSHVQSTFYPIPKDLVTTESTSSREMISLAVQIKTCPDQRRKRIRVAAGIQSATLRHNLALPQHTWLTQLLDMFDVEDYPVQGYVPYGVVTELHLHLWDCAIDYRPLHFPYRAVATLGTFMISSNIAAASTGCTLRFIAEDCTLSLAPQIPLGNTKNRSENKITALPSSELICIVDLGLFEISLRLNDKPTPSFPKFDLRASINDVHLRTCSDSGNAFAQFIAYLAAEGDLDDVKDDLSEDEQSLTMSEGEAELLPIKPGTPNAPAVTKSQQLRVNTLMAEAMEESLRIITTIDDKTPMNDQGVDVFFFPDEANVSEKKRESLTVEEASELEDYSLMGHGVKLPFNEDAFAHMYDKDGGADLKELLDFETSVMASKSNEEVVEEVESLPQVADDLGKVPSRVLTSRKISSDTDDDFCFIAEEEKVHRLNYAGQDVSVTEDPIRIVDNHFSIPIGKQDLLQAPKDFPMAVERYTLCEMSLVWHLYGGNDFPTKDEAKNVKTSSGSKKKTSMSETYKMGVSYSKGSPSVVLGSNPYSKLTWKTKGGVGRKHDVLMEIQINKVRFSHETYPTNTEQASRQVLLVTELEIRDKLSASNINKFLYHPAVGPKTIYGTQHMIAIKALHLRPDPLLPTQECCLRVSLLPLRLNIDQDSLLFLVSFFSEFGGSSVEEELPPQRSHATPPHQPPVMMVELPEAAQELQARKMISENLLLLIEEEERESECNESISDAGENTPVYFRNIVFSPDVPIRLDYQGKRVELSHGPLAGLLMGLGQLQCSEIRLKRISHRHGILGFDRLLNFLLQEWLQDIKRNQLPSILGGVGPMYSFVQLFQGIRDLFWLPIEQYQKDGRIVRGLQRGAQSFTARTALAALEITTRIIHLLQITAETAYDMVSPGPSVRRGRNNKRGKRKRFNPPKDIRAGVASAYQIVRDGIGETAHQIVDVATIEHDQKGYTGAVGAVVRQIPPTFIRPLVLATQATSKVLGGVRNQLVPDARVEAKDKWKDEDEI